MHKRKSFLVGILLVAMLVTVGVGGCTSDELTALEGIFQNMDSVSGTITVLLKDGSTQTFNFSDVKAETIRQALGDLSIEPGDTVISIDSVSGTITVQLKDGSTQTFNFSDVKAETIRQALGYLSIGPGDTVILQVDRNGDVQEIEGNNNDVDDGDVNDVDEEEEELKVEGLVTAYGEGVSIEVDGQLFSINEDTDIEGTPVVGTSIVEVKYVVQDDGSFLAVEIGVQNDED
jgi:hypothetical protein